MSLKKLSKDLYNIGAFDEVKIVDSLFKFIKGSLVSKPDEEPEHDDMTVDTRHMWKKYHNWLKHLSQHDYIKKTLPLMNRATGLPRTIEESIVDGLNYRNCPICESTIVKEV